MRVLHLSKFYPPDPGGLEHIVCSLAVGFAARGHEVRVVCARGARWRGVLRSDAGTTTQSGVTVVRLPTPRVLWSQPLARGYVAAARWPADVVYVHRPHPLADFAALRTRAPGLILFHHSDVQRQRAVWAAYAPLARIVARMARAVVVGAEANLQQARDLGAAGRRKARVIPFGVDESQFQPKSLIEPPHMFFAPPRGAGLFVGRLVSYKGLDVLLRAVAGTSLRVVIVGDGPCRSDLERDVERLGLRDRVALVGEVSEQNLPAYYQSADFFVLPSTTPAEMFGVAMVEAMACGIPVISTTLPTGVREVNAAGTTGLEVPPGDHQALRAAMVQLVGDKDLRARMGAAARRHVERRFTLTRMIQAHIELCEEVAGAGRQLSS